MYRYVALLRGINVGSHRLKMERLRAMFTELGFDNVRSYINSGNIFFDTGSSDRLALARSIEQYIREIVGYEVPVFLRTIPELACILTQDPFKGIELTKDVRFCVVFTHELLDTQATLPQHSSKQDMDLVGINPYEAFVVWHIINGKPPSGTFAAHILPSSNTTRFFHTLEKVVHAAQHKT